MILVLSLFLLVIGLFFLFLGLLFINYELSPLKKIIDKKYVYKSNKLGFQIILPGSILIVMSYWIMINN